MNGWWRGVLVAMALGYGTSQAIAHDPAAGTVPIADQGLRSMSKAELIALALSAAPPRVARDAAVMLPNADGILVTVRAGRNGFVCIPALGGRPKPDPVCMNRAARRWFIDRMNGVPRPTNTEPGIAYRARGGWHLEKNGAIVIDAREPGAKRVREPAHWLILWPFDATTTGLPSGPNPGGTFVMLQGTPYAHAVVYQDPRTLE